MKLSTQSTSSGGGSCSLGTPLPSNHPPRPPASPFPLHLQIVWSHSSPPAAGGDYVHSGVGGDIAHLSQSLPEVLDGPGPHRRGDNCLAALVPLRSPPTQSTTSFPTSATLLPPIVTTSCGSVSSLTLSPRGSLRAEAAREVPVCVGGGGLAGGAAS